MLKRTTFTDTPTQGAKKQKATQAPTHHYTITCCYNKGQESYNIDTQAPAATTRAKKATSRTTAPAASTFNDDNHFSMPVDPD